MNNENKPIQRKSNNEMKNMARGMSKEQRKQIPDMVHEIILETYERNQQEIQ